MINCMMHAESMQNWQHGNMQIVYHTPKGAGDPGA